MHILLIDDDPVFLRLIERQLPRVGHQVSTAESTEAALALLQGAKPDIILVDLGLPGVVGASFVDALAEAAPSVPFAIITGLQDVERSVEMMRRGALDYLVKDSNLHDRLPSALARIEEHLRRAQSLREIESAHQESEGRRLALMMAAHDGIVEFATDGCITFANPAAHRLLGVDENGLLGQDGRRYFTNLAHSLGATSDQVSPSNQVLDAAGMQLAAEASFIVAPARDRIYHAVIIRDISDRLRLEQEILNISEEERLGFGRDLHDGLGQQMAALSILSNLLANRLAKQGSECAPDAAKISQGIAEAIRESRAMAHELAPLGVSEQGLVRALTKLSQQLEETHHICCTFSHDEHTDITAPDVALHLYRMAQEATSNAIRHGQAKNIAITLTKVSSAYCLSIIDDGCGFSEITVGAGNGLGLRTIRHRAQVIGGQLEIQSAPQVGTQIHCRLPARPHLHPITTN